MLADLFQTIPAIGTGLKGKDTRNLSRTSGEMEKLARAQYDPRSPIYKRLYQGQQEQGQQDLAATIAEVSRQNRKLNTMGRSPLLDQERGGESVFRNLIMGQQDVGNRARSNTLDQLGTAQRSMAGIYDAQNDLAGQDYQNKIRDVGAYYSIGDALRNFFNLNKRQDTTSVSNGDTIYWN